MTTIARARVAALRAGRDLARRRAGPPPERRLRPAPGPWPPELDVAQYRATHADLASLTHGDLVEHWFRHGIAEGRAGSSAATRAGFLSLLADADSILEIGPLDTPVVRGPHVEYFDVVPTAELRAKAAALGRDPTGCPDIHHVSPVGDLAVIPRAYARVVSSHAIEHQPDLVAHLESVDRLLEPGGTYFVIVPDQRYCFDHFLPPSSVAAVVGAHAQRATLHHPTHVVNTIAMRTHNDPVRHWAGDHGEPAWIARPELLVEAYELCVGSPDAYLDTHAWQFTPATFRTAIDTLHGLGLSPFVAARVYETVRDGIEFYAVLEKPR